MKSTLLNLISLCLLSLSTLAQTRPSDSLRLTSPDGQLQFTFELQPGGVPTYEITHRGNAVVLPSRLGLLKNPAGLSGANDWNRDFRVVGTQKRSQNVTWKPVYGERSTVKDHYNELTITLLPTAPNRPALQLLVRAYDAGVAFRYQFPEDLRAQILDIGQEDTHLKFPPGTDAGST